MGVAVICLAILAAHDGLRLVCTRIDDANAIPRLCRIGKRLNGIDCIHPQGCQYCIGSVQCACHSFKPCVGLGFGVHNTNTCQTEAGCGCRLARYRVGVTLGANRHRAQLALDTCSGAAHLEGSSGPGIVTGTQNMCIGADQRCTNGGTGKVCLRTGIRFRSVLIVFAGNIDRDPICQEVGNVHDRFLGGQFGLVLTFPTFLGGQQCCQLHRDDISTGQADIGRSVERIRSRVASRQKCNRTVGIDRTVSSQEGGSVRPGSCRRGIVVRLKQVAFDLIVGRLCHRACRIVGINVDVAGKNGTVGVDSGVEAALGIGFHAGHTRANQAGTTAALELSGSTALCIGTDNQTGNPFLLTANIGVSHLCNGCCAGVRLCDVGIHARRRRAAAIGHLHMGRRSGACLIQLRVDFDLLREQIGVCRFGSLNRLHMGIKHIHDTTHEAGRCRLCHRCIRMNGAHCFDQNRTAL